MTLYDLSPYRLPSGHLRRYSDLGGYPIYYVVADGGVLCPSCASTERPDVPDAEQDEQWRIIGAEVNWEDATLQCDHCAEDIEVAYPPDNANREDKEDA